MIKQFITSVGSDASEGVKAEKPEKRRVEIRNSIGIVSQERDVKRNNANSSIITNKSDASEISQLTNAESSTVQSKSKIKNVNTSKGIIPRMVFGSNGGALVNKPSVSRRLSTSKNQKLKNNLYNEQIMEVVEEDCLHRDFEHDDSYSYTPRESVAANDDPKLKQVPAPSKTDRTTKIPQQLSNFEGRPEKYEAIASSKPVSKPTVKNLAPNIVQPEKPATDRYSASLVGSASKPTGKKESKVKERPPEKEASANLQSSTTSFRQSGKYSKTEAEKPHRGLVLSEKEQGSDDEAEAMASLDEEVIPPMDDHKVNSIGLEEKSVGSSLEFDVDDPKYEGDASISIVNAERSQFDTLRRENVESSLRNSSGSEMLRQVSSSDNMTISKVTILSENIAEAVLTPLQDLQIVTYSPEDEHNEMEIDKTDFDLMSGETRHDQLLFSKNMSNSSKQKNALSSKGSMANQIGNKRGHQSNTKDTLTLKSASSSVYSFAQSAATKKPATAVEEALAAFDGAIPKFSIYYCSILILLRRSREADKELSYNFDLAVATEDLFLLSNVIRLKVCLLIEERRLEEAVEAVELLAAMFKYQRCEVGDAMALFTLGYCRFQLGELGRAKQHFRECMKKYAFLDHLFGQYYACRYLIKITTKLSKEAELKECQEKMKGMNNLKNYKKCIAGSVYKNGRFVLRGKGEVYSLLIEVCHTADQHKVDNFKVKLRRLVRGASELKHRLFPI